MRPETKLARIFTDLEDGGKRQDSVAAGILAIVAEEKVRTANHFNTIVSAAYQANGWNSRAGRPSVGSNLKEVPGTVRTYVTTVRRALMRGINVASCKTFYELRERIRATKVRTAFCGLEEGDSDLGHDVSIVCANLPKQKKAVFEKKLRSLLEEFAPSMRGIKSLELKESEEKETAPVD